MSGMGNEREALRSWLEWLQLAGVDHITRGTAAGQSASPDGNAVERPMGNQIGLFGGATLGSAGPAESPLTLFEAPAAENSGASLALVREDLGDCTRCRLSEKRTQIVFGVGDPAARLMFVGEGPGADEDRQGEPFVGRAGQLLTRIIESMGLQRAEVYIANVVKCRPPENRTPQTDEITTCSPFMFQQILAIRPRVLVCLGTPATQTVLGTRSTITRLRGRFHDVAGIRIMPTFHPAYLLRNPAAKKDVWEDMKKVMACLKSEGRP
jgi:DNA polymerase